MEMMEMMKMMEISVGSVFSLDFSRFLAENVPDFVHVTVADDDLDVFKRAWCVALSSV
jgi:hypothetical protein